VDDMANNGKDFQFKTLKPNILQYFTLGKILLTKVDTSINLHFNIFRYFAVVLLTVQSSYSSGGGGTAGINPI
jgi:hypothetical protein